MIDSIPSGDVNIKTVELGNKKVSFWKYENEWRYKVSPYTDVVIPTNSLTTAPVNENDMFCLVPYEGEILEVITAPRVEDKTIQRLKTLLGDNYCSLVKCSEIKMNKI